MIRWFALISSPLVVVVIGLGAQRASADCCMGPPISVSLPLNSPLTSTLRPIVVNDDPDHPAEGTVRALLNVHGKRIADLGTVSTQASTTPREIVFDVPQSVRKRALRAAGHDRYPRAIVKFVVVARDIPSGIVTGPYGNDAFVTLNSPTPTRGPTKLSLEGAWFSGSGQRASGSVTVHTPHGWPRTSAPGAGIATFEPLSLEPDCNGHVTVQPELVAARSASSHLDDQEQSSNGPVVAGGWDRNRSWRIRTTSHASPFRWTTAVGLVPVAHHRYAGVHITVGVAPRCSPTALRSSRLLAALRHAVQTVDARVRVRSPRRG